MFKSILNNKNSLSKHDLFILFLQDITHKVEERNRNHSYNFLNDVHILYILSDQSNFSPLNTNSTMFPIPNQQFDQSNFDLQKQENNLLEL
mgnify:FL=1